ncbi:MAG: NAD(P)H-dependent oxidoreductase [Burkholderiales bacterium]|uniref:NADPH-dependent FMN reductase n=1 Tax=Ottowia sp. TaxID=1898956 RepID=UPI001AC16D11|nr:NADPH-dependent FMN reductase [Ottowia sp.]MBN9405567.1 NAD(P)H-dependent oxidoreductase [Burkholderiales bacterium]MBS0403432.1 NAD(P)H-dependent oxidoreductase [Pseudomonadota bacterium]
MSQLNLAVVVGSLRKESFNRQFAEALVKLLPADVKPHFIRIDDLPLYNQDSDGAPPVPAVKRLRDEVAAAHGVLFVTPEYNRSMPGVLKNAIDQASRPWGQSKWAGKPAAVCGMSVGAIGTSMAQAHLRNVLAYLDMPLLGQPEMYFQWKEGVIVNGAIGPASHDLAQKFMNAVVAWMRRHQA